MRLDRKISEDLAIPDAMLEKALLYARKLVKRIKVKKKNGEFRTVYQPSRKLKVIQYWLIRNVFSEMNVHECATAYQEDICIKHNADKHLGNKYLVKLDFENFFPSIQYKDLQPILSSWHKKTQPGWDLDDDAGEIVRKVCFYEGDRLPIGYPSSPVISNVVMYDFDFNLLSLLSDEPKKFGNVVYTRYADDMVLSTDKKGACKQIHSLVKRLVKTTNSPKLKLNNMKTRYVSSSGGSALVTGLRICHDNHITLHRRYKDKVRLLVSLYKKGKLGREDIQRFRGHLAHIRSVDAVFYTKLHKKHFKTLERLRRDS